ncbi:MAG: hypothetical protein ACK5NG_00355 [Chthoniobacterales bacterium]
MLVEIENAGVNTAAVSGAGKVTEGSNHTTLLYHILNQYGSGTTPLTGNVSYKGELFVEKGTLRIAEGGNVFLLFDMNYSSNAYLGDIAGTSKTIVTGSDSSLSAVSACRIQEWRRGTRLSRLIALNADFEER